MKITAVSITVFRRDSKAGSALVAHLPGTRPSARVGLLRIETDEGITGSSLLGGAIGPVDTDGQTVLASLKPLLMGQDPLDRERLYHAMLQSIRRTTWRAIGAVDVALWDLAGKKAGLPIHKLLGSYRSKVRAYVSSSRLNGGAEAYVEQLSRMKAAGYTAYKIHPPADPDECIEVCRAVREAAGPGYVLMLDPAWTFDYPQAVRVGLAIQELGFYWYEDPLAADDIYNYVKLKQQLHIPLLATEISPGGFTGYAPWLTERATDYLRGDVAIKGGLTGIVKGAHLAEAFRMNYEVHYGGNSLNDIANLHAIMAIRNCEFYEVFMPDGDLKFGVVNDIEVDKEGFVHAYDGPGLGANLDYDLIDNNTVAVWS
jgi:L-alanine-DL-glutamate epimerase-like enolase superfamily enzyme